MPSCLLNTSQENSLLDVLKKNKQAIGWKISDLKGSTPWFAPITSTWKSKRNK